MTLLLDFNHGLGVNDLQKIEEVMDNLQRMNVKTVKDLQQLSKFQ